MCRYWRTTVVSTPDNWTRISSRRIGLARLSLERCKAAPLQLWLDVDSVGVPPEFFDLIAPYIHNAHSLNVGSGSTPEELAQTLQNILPSTPNLRSLTLAGGGPRLDFPSDPCSHLTSSLTYLYLWSTPLYPSLLRLRTLTHLTLFCRLDFHLNTFLDFLEKNLSLERAILGLRFSQPSLQDSRGRAPMKNRLQHLSISSGCAMSIDALISNIAVQRGGHLKVCLCGQDAKLKDLRSVLSTARLLNPLSPTFMEYRTDYRGHTRTIRLRGPNGIFSLERWSEKEALFVEFPLLPLHDIRTFHLGRSAHHQSDSIPTVFLPLSFPNLETLVIEREIAMSYLLSVLLSDPPSSPSLKTLAFLDCRLDEGFLDELTRFAYNRKKSTSAKLRRVVIINSTGQLPPFAFIDELEEHVPVVDICLSKELPSDLKWNGLAG